MNEHYQKWDEMAPRGMLAMGLGLTLIGQAVLQRSRGRGFLLWFITGTLGLIAFNSGMAFFGEAIKQRTLYDLEVKKMQDAQAGPGETV